MPQKKTAAKRKKRELTGLGLIAVGIFLFICMLVSTTGALGRVMRPLLLGIFGSFAYLFPLLLCIAGGALIMKDRRKVHWGKLTVVMVAIIVLLSLIHVLSLKRMDTFTYWTFIRSSYEMGQEMVGLGATASILTYPVWKLIGTPGSIIAYCTVLLALLVLYSNMSLKKVGDKVKDGYVSCKKYIDEKTEEKKAAKQRLYTETMEECSPEEAFQTNVIEKDYTFLHNHGKKIDALLDQPEPEEPPNISEPQGVTEAPVEKGAETEVNQPDGEKNISCNDVSTYQPVFDMRDDAGFLHLLKQPETNQKGKNKKELENRAAMLEQALESFNVNAKVVNITCGPTITRYELQLAYGVKTSKILSLTNDIKMALAAKEIRIEAPIPGKNAVGIEIPNEKVRIVYLREVLESQDFIKHKSKLAFALGIDIDGKSIVADLERMPHLMIAGTTGSGKSVCINNLILSYLYNTTPDEVKMIMVDPKMVELASYNELPHMLIPVVTDSKKAAGALRWALNEMERRYMVFSQAGVRQLSTYNANSSEPLPRIVVIVDELADLMMVAAQEVEETICRIAQKGRAAGIHLVLATQRPSVNVITGIIKANIPSRIAFQVFSQVDSRTILDMAGAERLLGRGDMLYHPNGVGHPIRLQGAFVSEKEVQDITAYIKERSSAQYSEDIIEQINSTASGVGNTESKSEYDELLPQAIKVFLDKQEASISLLQRKMRVGYARAARIVDEMEEMGIVSGPDGSKPRDVLISYDDYHRMFEGGEN